MTQDLKIGDIIEAIIPDWMAQAESLRDEYGLPITRVVGRVAHVSAKSIFVDLEGPAKKRIFLALSLIQSGKITVGIVNQANPDAEPTAFSGTIAQVVKPFPDGRIYLSKDQKFLYAETPFEHKDRCSMVLGGKWDYDLRAWRYPATPITALALADAFNGTKVNQTDVGFQALVVLGKRVDEFADIKLADEDALAQPEGLKTRLWIHQLRALHFASALGSAAFFMAMGVGKAQPLSSPVLTPDGWMTMGEMRVGQVVINSSGQVSRVTGVYPQGMKQIYKVTFSDGTSTRCVGEHLWTVNTPSRKYRGLPYQTLTTLEIAQDLRDGAGNAKHFIPMIAPVEFAERELPIAPYLMGVLLGDGCMSHDMAVSLTGVDQELLDEVARLLPATVTLNVKKHDAISYGLSRTNGYHGGTLNPIIVALRELGLMGHRAEEKFIPRAYMFASRRQREALLQGLLDTDGSVNPANKNIEFVTVSERLMRDVAELVQSLGGVVYIGKKTPTYVYLGETRNGQVAYRANLVLPNEIAPFRLTRKAERVLPRTKYLPTRAIVSIEPDGVEEAQCIMVDAPDHLYVTDHYILTHNTLTTIAFIVHNHIQRALVLAPKSVVAAWPKDVAKHAGSDKFIVCALDEGSVASKVKRAEAAYAEGERTGKPVIIVVNYESAWRFPFGLETDDRNRSKETGFAFTHEFDLLVLDESHKIKNAQGRTAKFCHRLAKRIAHKLLLTGTPMPHDPLDIFSQFLVLDGGATFGTSFTKFRARYAQMGGYGGYQILGYQNVSELQEKMYRQAFRVTEDAVELPERVFLQRYGVLSAAERKAYNDMEERMMVQIEELANSAAARDELAAMLEQPANLVDTAETWDMFDQWEQHSGRASVIAQNVLSKILKLAQLSSGFILDEEGQITEYGSSKLDLLMETLEDIDRAEPFVVFVRFKHDIDAIAKRLGEAGYTYAELSGRRNQLQAWQNGEQQALIVQLQSGGVGVDFTKNGDKPCKYCIYFGKDYNWGNFVQSLKRIHRPGQTETVRFITLLMENTVDGVIEEVLENRGNLVESVLAARSLRTASQHVTPQGEAIDLMQDALNDAMSFAFGSSN